MMPAIKTKIKAVLIDLGNVTVNFNHYLAVEKIAHITQKSADEIYQLFFDSSLTALFEEGKLTPKEFYCRLKELLCIDIGYKEFTVIWNEIFFVSPDNLKVHSLIKKFREKFTVILISNINKLHFEYLSKEYPILYEFDKHVLSYEVGVRKPHPLIYKKALSAASAENFEAVYIDDREDLIRQGTALGIESICFKDYPGLIKTLEHIGIK